MKMKHINKTEPAPVSGQHRPEIGAAGIIIELSQGKIKVFHQEGKRLLLTRDVELGFWCNHLFPLLRGTN